MKRLEGGYLGGRPTWSLASNPGIWGIEQVYARRAAGTWPISTGSFDEFYEYVTLSLHMDGSNNSTSFITSQLSPRTVTGSGNAKISTADFKFGGASAYFDGSGDYLTLGNAPLRFLGEDFTIEFWCKIETNVGGSAASNFPYLMSTSVYNANGGFYIAINGSNTGWGGSGVLNFSSSTGSNGPGLASTSVIRNAGWKHIAITRQGSNFRMFVDGVLESLATDSDASYTGNSGYLMVSTNTDGTVITTAGANEKGYIDDLRITKGYARYTSNFSVPTGPYEDEGAPLADPFYNYVSLLLPMNGSNNSTTFTDRSPNALTVTANGDAKLSTADKRYGVSSAYFDGTGDFLTIADANSGFSFGTGDFTYEWWFKSNATNNYAAMLTRPYSGAGGILISLNGATGDGAPEVYWREWQNGLFFKSSITGLNDNKWHHFAFVRSGTTVYMFIDGVQAASKASVSTSVGSSSVIIGQDIQYAGRTYTGYIDDLRITKGVARYTTNFIPPLPHGDYGTLADPYLAATSLLMPMEGPANSTGFFDRAKRQPVTTYGNAKISNAQYKWGLTSGAFDGTGDYLSIASNNVYVLDGDFTVEFWLYANNSNSNQGIMSNGAGSFGGTAFTIVFDHPSFVNEVSMWNYPSRTTTAVCSTGTLSTETWNHVAFTRRGSTVTAYLNGIAGTNFTTASTFNLSATELRIGTYWNGSINGYIDDLRIIKGHAIYTNNFTTPTAPINSEAGNDPYFNNVSLLLKMDGGNNSTTFTDSSPTPKTVSANGNAKISTDQSKFGGASAVFDGNGDYLTVPNSSAFNFGTGDFTVELWVNMTSTSATRQLLVGNAYSSGTWTGWYLQHGSSTGFVFGDAGTTLISCAYSTTGQWVHLAVTRQGTSLRIFLNGVQQGSTVTNSSNIDGTHTTLRIGYLGSVELQYLNGYIDELRITKGVARYTASFVPLSIPYPTA
jgi:hypothetical protein